MGRQAGSTAGPCLQTLGEEEPSPGAAGLRYSSRRTTRGRNITRCYRAEILIRKNDKRQNHHLVLQGRGALILDTFEIRHLLIIN